LDGDAGGVSASDDALLLQRQMDVGRDDGQFLGDRRRNVSDGIFVQYRPAWLAKK